MNLHATNLISGAVAWAFMGLFAVPVSAGPTHGGLAAPKVTISSGKLKKKTRPQTHCPVTGDKLKNHDVFIDYEGQRVYFCCPGCDKMFLKDPEKYLKKLGRPTANSGKHQEMGHTKNMR